MPVLNSADAYRIGADTVDKIYLGTDVVWELNTGPDHVAEVMARNPLAYYRLQELAGPTMSDSSGNNRHGTYAGTIEYGVPALIENQGAVAINFINGAGSVPVAAWMQTSVMSAHVLLRPRGLSGNKLIFGRADVHTSFGAGWSWLFHRIGASLRCNVFINNTGTNVELNLGTMALGEAISAGVSFDGTTVRGYRRGVQVASAALAGTLSSSPGIDLTVGAEHGLGYSPFDGDMEEAAVFGTVLTADDFAALHASRFVDEHDPAYQDRFDGGALGAGWTRRGIVSGDETWTDKLAVANFGPTEGYLRDLPAGLPSNFALELEYTAASYSGQMVGPWILDNSGNGIAATWYNSPSALLVVGSSAYSYASLFVQGDVVTPPLDSRVRLSKLNNAYTAEYSLDSGRTWSRPVQWLTSAVTPTKIGFGKIFGGNVDMTFRDFTVRGFTQYTPVAAAASMAHYLTHAAANMIDGDLATKYWSSAALPAGEWLKVDLGSVKEIAAVDIRMGGSDAAPTESLNTWQLQVSDDDVNWTPVREVFTWVGRIVDVPPGTKGRYVRVLNRVSTGANWIQCRQFNVYGPA